MPPEVVEAGSWPPPTRGLPEGEDRPDSTDSVSLGSIGSVKNWLDGNAIAGYKNRYKIQLKFQIQNKNIDMLEGQNLKIQNKHHGGI